MLRPRLLLLVATTSLWGACVDDRAAPLEVNVQQAETELLPCADAAGQIVMCDPPAGGDEGDGGSSLDPSGGSRAPR